MINWEWFETSWKLLLGLACAKYILFDWGGK